MKSILPIILLFLILASCSKSDGLYLPSDSTIPIETGDSQDLIIQKAAHVVPTPNQYEALQREFIAFLHFGPNTFTRMEWGNGMEDPAIFALEQLDTDQWCQAMKAAGMKLALITAKHHDGFVLWQSRYTTHGIMSSPYQDGQGDILKELAASCQKYGLKLGVYLSPADLYQIEHPQGLYGNLSSITKRSIPRPVEGRPFADTRSFEFEVDDYNEYFLNQLFELLTEYGPIDEVWFDGAHPKRKGGQQYNYGAWRELIRELAPEAVIFGKEDIRWCGNESGGTRETEWNIIPYQDDPRSMNQYGDLTPDSLGHQAQLYQGNYLHYQPAETNTSIREGWFYRDETDQKVRSADDVFDIYERAVGGNSIFLLNIPPNREGRFSPEDVQVLEEVGKRIQETYGENLLQRATGERQVLDGDLASYVLMNAGESIEISLPEPVRINRFAIQEAISTHSERVEEHVLEAWQEGAWQEIAQATNIGYKRILRFPAVTSDRFRLRISKARLEAAIANVSAHYYPTRPPELAFQRNLDGLVSIQPKQHLFRWKPHGENPSANLSAGMEIRYTLDGSNPTKDSELYQQPFLAEASEVKARTFQMEQTGPISSQVFGLLKTDWKLWGMDSWAGEHTGEFAFDEDPATYWRSGEKGRHYLEINLGKEQTLSGFSYTPQLENSEGMIETGSIQISKNGKRWRTVMKFSLGNLINDPSTRRVSFPELVSTQYVRIQGKQMAGGSRTMAIAEIGFF